MIDLSTNLAARDPDFLTVNGVEQGNIAST
jgi:hypothetical protein